ncbi:MAG TPA: DUF5010 domain-containing protein, partial [Candidatus Baltobacteraceae bacterium]
MKRSRLPLGGGLLLVLSFGTVLAACSGGNLVTSPPTAAPTSTQSASPAATGQTAAPTSTATSHATPTPSSPAPSSSPSATPGPSAMPTPSVTPTRSPSPSPSPTVAPTATPTAASTSMSSVTIGTSTSLLGPGVSAQDFALVQPNTQGVPLNAPIFGYEMSTGIAYLPQNTEIPMYTPYDRDDAAWWDEQADELMFSRVPFTLLHGRGCLNPTNPNDISSNGNMCPRLLSNMVAAVNRAGLGSVA